MVCITRDHGEWWREWDGCILNEEEEEEAATEEIKKHKGNCNINM